MSLSTTPSPTACLVDVLPDGMTYVPESAQLVDRASTALTPGLAPRSVEPNTPGPGQTTHHLGPASQHARRQALSSAITFRAVVDPTYEAAPYTDEPVVSGDRLTNRVTDGGQWQDAVDHSRLGSLTPDTPRPA